MAKETEEQKQERLNFDRLVRLTSNLLGWLMREPASLDALGFSERDKNMLLMRWKYGLTIEQMAGNLSLSKERTRQIQDKLITALYVRIPRVLTEYADMKKIKQENKQLKREIEKYKVMLEVPETKARLQVRKNEMIDKKITDLGLRTRTVNRLNSAAIKTVQDLLEFDTASLFAIKGFNVIMMGEIEEILWKHGLSIKRG